MITGEPQAKVSRILEAATSFPPRVATRTSPDGARSGAASHLSELSVRVLSDGEVYRARRLVDGSADLLRITRQGRLILDYSEQDLYAPRHSASSRPCRADPADQVTPTLVDLTTLRVDTEREG